jgi:DNA polymerase III subunit epsilon
MAFGKQGPGQKISYQKRPGPGMAQYYGDKYAPEGYTYIFGQLRKKSDLRVEESVLENSGKQFEEQSEEQSTTSAKHSTMNRKTLWFDLRTTGPDPKYHGIVQFAGLIEIKGEIVDQLNIRMQPHSGAVIDQETMQANGMTSADIAGFIPSDEGYRMVRAFFDKHVEKYDPKDKMYPAGYNVRFDLDFMQAWFRKFDKYGIGVYFNWRGIDPLPLLYLMDFTGRFSLPDYRLPAVCSHFGIPLKRGQDGLIEVRAARELTRKLITSSLAR